MRFLLLLVVIFITSAFSEIDLKKLDYLNVINERFKKHQARIDKLYKIVGKPKPTRYYSAPKIEEASSFFLIDVKLQDEQEQIDDLYDIVYQKRQKRIFLTPKKPGETYLIFVDRMLQNHTAQIDRLYETIEENKAVDLIKKIDLGLDITTTYHYLDGNYFKAREKKHIDSSRVSSLFGLDFTLALTQKIDLASRLCVAKNWIQNSDYHTKQQASNDNNNLVFLDKAYLDYFFSKDVSLRLGRQQNGVRVGANLKDKFKDESYPSMLFDVGVDGISLNIMATKDLAIRLGLAKAYQYDEDIDKDTIYVDTGANIDNSYVYSLVLDTSLADGIGENMFVLGLLHVKDTRLYYYNESLGDIDVGLGDFSQINMHFENTHTFGTNFSYYFSVGYLKKSNRVDNSGMVNATLNARKEDNAKGYYLSLLKNSMSHASASTTADLMATAAIDGNKTIINDDISFQEKDGHAVFVGLGYDFDESFRLGYHFFYGSKYWYGMIARSINDPIGLTQTRGTAHDLYGIWSFNENQFLRLGATMVQYDYTRSGSLVGTPVKTTSDKSLNYYTVTYSLNF